MEDQKMQEFMNDMQQEKGDAGDGIKMPQGLRDKLSPEEQEELEEKIEKSIEDAKNKDEGRGNENEEQDRVDGELKEVDTGRSSLFKR